MPKLVLGKVDPARDADRQIGARIRQRRVALGLTQQQVATMVGVTYQQAYKYESGMNPVSAGRLFDFAQVLDVNVAYFFGGQRGAPADTKIQDRLMFELARNFAAMSNPAHREAVAALVRTMAAVDLDDEDSEQAARSVGPSYAPAAALCARNRASVSSIVRWWARCMRMDLAPEASNRLLPRSQAASARTIMVSSMARPWASYRGDPPWVPSGAGGHNCKWQPPSGHQA